MLHHESLRTKEERDRDYGSPRTAWAQALTQSLLWATEEGCEELAQRPGHSYVNNHTWNICMQKAGIFTKR